MHTRLGLRLLVAALLAGSILSAAPPEQPAPPAPPVVPAPQPTEQAQVVVRYRIEAARNERLARYFRLMDDLAKAGFVRDPKDEPSQIEPENVQHTRLQGTLPRAAVARVLRQPDVQALLLIPVGQAAGDKQVRVELRLRPGLAGPQQRDLHAQARQALVAGGFAEALGYDTRGDTRLLGVAPVEKLGVLLDDLRRQPAAWTQLPGSFLADLRKQDGGPEVLGRVVDAWQEIPAGAKLLGDAVARWQAYPAAIDYFRTLPFETTQNPILFYAKQLNNFVEHPDSAELLVKLFDDVRKSEAARPLMDVLLARVESSGRAFDVPVLFRVSPPVRVVDVQTDLPLPAIPGAPAEIPMGQEKLSADLRAIYGDAAEAMKPRRFEVLLRDPIPSRDRRWADRFVALPVTVEGRLGSIVTVFGPPAEAAKIAAVPDVVAVRLPRTATETAHPERDLADAVRDEAKDCRSLVRQYIDAGRLRQAVVVGSDFRGWEALKGNGLPGGTRLLDLTRERNRDLEPDPMPGDPKEAGLATRAALALFRAAGTADLLLVRVDPESPYQLDYVARLTAGEPEVSLSLAARLRDLADDRRQLEGRAERLREERERVLTDFRPEAEKLREGYQKRQAEYDKDRREFDGRQARYLAHEALTNQARKMRTVYNTLSWDDGHALFDSGALSRYLDDLPYPGLWLQSRGGDLRRLWFGLFRDADHSGAIDLLPPGEPLPAGRWSPDAGFLAWKPSAGERVVDLPAGAKLRVAVQWKEAHDADLARLGTDFYLEPLAKFNVQVLQQLDPKGETRPADDLALVGRSSGAPQRLLNTPRFAVYEVSVDVTVETPGRYLVRVEGTAPDSTRPRNLPTIPAAREVGELYPRVVVRTLAGPGEALFERPVGRPSLPMPADAQRAVPVGGRE